MSILRVIIVVLVFRALSLAQTFTPSILFQPGSGITMDAPTFYSAVFTLNPGQQLGFAFFTFAPWPASAYTCKVGVAVNTSTWGSGTPSNTIYLHDDQGEQLQPQAFATQIQQSN